MPCIGWRREGGGVTLFPSAPIWRREFLSPMDGAAASSTGTAPSSEGRLEWYKPVSKGRGQWLWVSGDTDWGWNGPIRCSNWSSFINAVEGSG